MNRKQSSSSLACQLSKFFFFVFCVFGDAPERWLIRLIQSILVLILLILIQLVMIGPAVVTGVGFGKSSVLSCFSLIYSSLCLISIVYGGWRSELGKDDFDVKSFSIEFEDFFLFLSLTFNACFFFLKFLQNSLRSL